VNPIRALGVASNARTIDIGIFRQRAVDAAATVVHAINVAVLKHAVRHGDLALPGAVEGHDHLPPDRRVKLAGDSIHRVYQVLIHEQLQPGAYVQWGFLLLCASDRE